MSVKLCVVCETWYCLTDVGWGWYSALITAKFGGLVGARHLPYGACLVIHWLHQWLYNCPTSVHLCCLRACHAPKKVCWPCVNHATLSALSGDRLIRGSWILDGFSASKSGSTCMQIALYMGIYGSQLKALCVNWTGQQWFNFCWLKGCNSQQTSLSVQNSSCCISSIFGLLGLVNVHCWRPSEIKYPEVYTV